MCFILTNKNDNTKNTYLNMLPDDLVDLLVFIASQYKHTNESRGVFIPRDIYVLHVNVQTL